MVEQNGARRSQCENHCVSLHALLVRLVKENGAGMQFKWSHELRNSNGLSVWRFAPETHNNFPKEDEIMFSSCGFILYRRI
jgi:hypothetical protein